MFKTRRINLSSVWPILLEEKDKSKFCMADFVYVIQKPSRGHYNSCTFVTQM